MAGATSSIKFVEYFQLLFFFVWMGVVFCSNWTSKSKKIIIITLGDGVLIDSFFPSCKTAAQKHFIVVHQTRSRLIVLYD